MKHLLLHPVYATFGDFRSLRHQVAWLRQAKPDFLSLASVSFQVTIYALFKVHVKILNLSVSRVHATCNLGLCIQRLALVSLRLAVYSDALLATSADHCTQLGYIGLLTDGTARAHALYLSAYIPHQVAWSVVGGELYALADAGDLALLLRMELCVALSTDVPTIVLADSFSLLDMVIRTYTVTAEEMLTIYIAAVREL